MNTVISFSCPAHLAMRLAEEKIPSREKSKWISDAIIQKLEPKEKKWVNDWDSMSENQKILQICHDEDVPLFIRRTAKTFNQLCGVECKSCPYSLA